MAFTSILPDGKRKIVYPHFALFHSDPDNEIIITSIKHHIYHDILAKTIMEILEDLILTHP